MRTAVAISLALSALAISACEARAPVSSGVAMTQPATCRDRVTWLPAAALPDGTPATARALDTWLTRLPGGADPDRELLDPDQIARLNQRNTDVIGAWRDQLADEMPAPTDIDAELAVRLEHLGAKLASGEYVLGPEPAGTALPAPDAFQAARRRVENAFRVDAVQAVAEPIDLRCIPLAGGLYRGHIDRAFDRNQCSRLHPGDLVRVLRVSDDGWFYVRVGHGVGWLRDPVLSPPMSPRAARELAARPQLTVLDDLVPATTAYGDVVFLRLGVQLPLVDDAVDDGDTYQILVPTARGWSDAFVAKSARVVEGELALTYRNFLRLAFDRLDDPYGWGGLGGFRDCSSLLLDLAATFGIRLGRNSSVQARGGAVTVDVSGRSDDEKRAAIRDAGARGIVFLYMPGHIMLYLGELGGRDYALSAISEYLLPCPEGGHRTVRIDRVDVTDLERGRGTERTSFIERITTLAIFGS